MTPQQLNTTITFLESAYDNAKRHANRLRHVTQAGAYHDAQGRVTDISYDLYTLTKYRDLKARHDSLKHQEAQALTSNRSVALLRIELTEVIKALNAAKAEVEGVQNVTA